MNEKESRPRQESAPTHNNITADKPTGVLACRPHDAWRRRDWAHDLRVRRRRSRELDALLGVQHPAPLAGDVDLYAANGLTLGLPERIAAGRRLSASGSTGAVAA